MKRSMLCLIPVALAAAFAAGVPLAQERSGAPGRKPAASTTSADEEAVRKQAAEFAALFAKGDAKAIAATWTEQAEYYEESGIKLVGRAAIEQAFAEFFQAHPGCKTDVQIESIRFPARDLAVEEGTMVVTHAGPELPTSSRYSVLHVREDGQWRTAVAREWGGTEDRLHDLAWLIGDWSATTPKGEVRITFVWNSAKSAIEGTFRTTEEGRTVSSGHQHIQRDPQTGGLHSWNFDDAGGHGESFWSRDGNRWVLDAVGVTADGTQTAAANLLTRLSNDEFVWRSVNRAAGGDDMPHSDPIKVTRVPPAK
jgi:uncharacterized protein (TIGR02246 family)